MPKFLSCLNIIASTQQLETSPGYEQVLLPWVTPFHYFLEALGQLLYISTFQIIGLEADINQIVSSYIGT